MSLYKLTVRPIQTLVHDYISPSELWYRILSHFHYRALPPLGNMVTGLSTLYVEHDGICRGCALGNNAEGSFSSNENKSKGILDLAHSYLCEPMKISSLSGYLYYVIFEIGF
jgi:hypothetical protein